MSKNAEDDDPGRASAVEAPDPVSSVRPLGSYAPGNVIGNKYELCELLGEGGMGAVWRARNQNLDIDVAVKLIRRDITESEAAERLLLEARSAARIVHPSIVRVFDFGITDMGAPYFVMELVRGATLAKEIDRRGRFDAAEAVRLVLPVLDALAAVHAQGVIHRDLKPDNIVLAPTPTGEVVPKLLDFGIALFREASPSGRRVTTRGAVLGSPDYMAPEQARGERELDERVDVWAISVVLYELCAGVRPFQGDSYNALIAAILERDPLPLGTYAAGDKELWAIVEKGLAKPREDRFQTARALGEALAAWATQRGVEVDAGGVAIATRWLGRGSRPQLPEVSTAPAPSSSALATIMQASEKATEPPPEPALAPGRSEPPAQRRTQIAVATALLVLAVAAFAWLAQRAAGPSPTLTSAPTSEKSEPRPAIEPAQTAATTSLTPPPTATAPTATPVASAHRPPTRATSAPTAAKTAPGRDMPVPKLPDF